VKITVEVDRSTCHPRCKIISIQLKTGNKNYATCFANVSISDWLLKKSKVVASFKGRLSYAASSQLAISFLREMNENTNKQKKGY